MVKPKTDPDTGETTAVLTDSDRKTLARARDIALQVLLFDTSETAGRVAEGCARLLRPGTDDPTQIKKAGAAGGSEP